MDEESVVVHGKLLLICSIALIGSFSVGGVIAYTSPAIPSINSNQDGNFYMNRNDESWFASIVHLGIAFGAISAGFLNQQMGRKWTMIVGTVPFLTGWLIIATSVHVAWMYIGRIVTGFCSGLMMATVSVYVVEMAPNKQWRGLYGSGHEVMVNVGILLTYIIGAFIVWQYLAITLASVLVLMIILMVYFLPETPRWLIANGHKERAKKILAWIYKEDHLTIIWRELEKTEVDKGNRTPWKNFLKEPLRKKLLTCLVLFALQEFSGSNVYRLYTVAIFDLAETPLDSNTEAIIIGVVGVLGSLVCAGLVDRMGRRQLLMMSMVAMSISNIVLGVYFVRLSGHNELKLGWIPLASLILFTLGYSCGLGPLPYVITVESFPIFARNKACAVTVACEGICAFIVTKYFVVLGALIDSYVPFFACGCICIVGLVFIYFFLPETKDSNLDEPSTETNIEAIEPRTLSTVT